MEASWSSGNIPPTEAEWDAQQPYIEEYYSTHPLRELIPYMAMERGFKAT